MAMKKEENPRAAAQSSAPPLVSLFSACLSLARPRARSPCDLGPSGIWLLGDFRRGQPVFGSWFVGLG